MKWTKDKPTKPGWYWVKFKKLQSEIYSVTSDERGKLWLLDRDITEPISSCEYIIAWAGPIEEPKE